MVVEAHKNQELIQQIQSLETEKCTLQQTLETQQQTLEDQQQAIETLQQKVNWFQEQFKLAQRRNFGKKTEVSSAIQPNLFDDLSQPAEEAAAPTEEPSETITYTRKKKTKGRNIDTSTLPREQVIHDLDESQMHCDTCLGALKQFGEDRVEILEYVPATIKVIEHITLKYACGQSCETVKMAKRPAGPIPKSMASSSLITEIIISKYEQHIPLYRRSKIFEKEGIDIPDNTLGNWVLKAGEILEPLGEAQWKQALARNYLQVDETPVKVLDEDKKGYMWCYHSLDPDNRFVIFDYNLSRAGKVAQERLKDFSGLLQTDGYSGYSYFRSHEQVVHFGCWAHARRKFVEAQQIAGNTGKGLAPQAINQIAKLYRIEHEAERMTVQQRKELRQDKAKPILEEINQWLIANKSKVPEKSTLGKAFTYAINQWPYLIAYINHGEVQIDNNLIENLIRPFALGRRNWLFIGNERAGRCSALLYSLIQTCKLNQINARKYFNYVLDQAHLIRQNQIDITSLLPQFIDINLITK